MSISQNEGVQAAAKAVAALEPRVNEQRPQADAKQRDKPEEKSVAASENRPYVVTLTDEAVKRSGATKEPDSGRPVTDNKEGTRVKQPEVESAFREPGKVEQEVTSATDEAAERAASGETPKKAGAPGTDEKQSTRVKQPEVENAFREPGKVEREVTSATDEAAERAAAGEAATAGNDSAGAGTAKGAEALVKEIAGGLKDPGTAEAEPQSMQQGRVETGPGTKAKEPQVLESTGTVAPPVDKRTTERLDKLDPAEELRKSISVYA